MDEKKAVLALLQDPSLQLSCEEIWKMMDEELAKPTEEVDGELVRECIAALSECREQRQNDTEQPTAETTAKSSKKIHHGSPIKVAIITAVLLLALLAIGVAAAKYFVISNADPNLVQIMPTCVRIDLSSVNRKKEKSVDSMSKSLTDVLATQKSIEQAGEKPLKNEKNAEIDGESSACDQADNGR